MTTPNDFLQLIGTDTPNAPGAAYLCCTYSPIANPGNPDSYRVHFNVPEGAQRFCGDAARIRMPRTDLVMLTRLSHSTMMGLPGYVLTSQDGVLTGKQKALSGKTAMREKEGGEWERTQPARGKERDDAEAEAERASNNNSGNPTHGQTNKQKQIVAAAGGALPPKNGANNASGVGGRVFLVGGPRDAISPVAQRSSSSAQSSTPLEKWWRAMVSMYFHYRPQGVVDLGFVRAPPSHFSLPHSPPTTTLTDGSAAPAAAVSEKEDDNRRVLFTVLLNGDRIDGLANSDFYDAYSPPKAEGRGCGPSCGGGAKRSRSPTQKCGHHAVLGGDGDAVDTVDNGGSGVPLPAFASPCPSSTAVVPPLLKDIAPLAVVSRLARHGVSHMIAIDTSSSSSPSSVASYWCRFPPPPPRFDHAIAKERFGVNPGPKYAMLKQGKAVPSDKLLAGEGLFEADGVTPLPLMVTLADVNRASLEAQQEREAKEKAAAGGAASSLSSAAPSFSPPAPLNSWGNMLVVDGDDEASIMAGLEGAMRAVRHSLLSLMSSSPQQASAGKSAHNNSSSSGHHPFNLFGRLTLVLILCPRSTALQGDDNAFKDRVARLFYTYSGNEAGTTAPTTTTSGVAEGSSSSSSPSTSLLPSAFPSVTCVSSRADLLSADEINGKTAVPPPATISAPTPTVADLQHQHQHHSHAALPLHLQLPPSAFPTALAHRYHLNALAGNYFPLVRRRDTEEEEDEEEGKEGSDAPSSPAPRHPMTLSHSSKVWWPFALIYRVMDGAVINPPRIEAINKGLEEERAAEEAKQAAASSSATVGEAPICTSPPPLPITITDPIANDQDPPLRYPNYENSVDMLSRAFKEMVVRYGESEQLAGLGLAEKAAGSAAKSEDVVDSAPAVVDTAANGDNGGAFAEADSHMLFLGTGSAVPSKYRNVSGLVVGNAVRNGGDVDGVSITSSASSTSFKRHPLLCTSRIVCDFGEGSIGQWAQFLGPVPHYLDRREGGGRGMGGGDQESGNDEVNALYALFSPLELALLTLRLVFISHNHADHVLGIFGLTDSYVAASKRVQSVVEAFLKARGLFAALNDDDMKANEGAADDDNATNVTTAASARPLLAAARFLLSLCQKPLLIVCPRNFRDFLEKTVPLLCTTAKETVGMRQEKEDSQQPPAAEQHEHASIPTQFDALDASPSAHVRRLIGHSVFTMDLVPLVVTSVAGALLLQHSSDQPVPRLFFEAYLRHHFGPSATGTIIPVDHPAQAHALFFRNAPDWSWCYSGDTRPWPLLNAIAQTDAYRPLQVLVHECTFDDDLKQEAVHKKHSTLSEALGAGVHCGAEHVLLNHFSQRYPKIPPAAAAAASRLRARQQREAAASLKEAEGEGEGEGGAETNAILSNDPADVPLTPATATPSSSSAVPTATEQAAASCPLPIIPFTFSFDGMLVPYASGLKSGDLVARLPLFQWLLNEYDGWSVGTSQRLRGRREAAANSAIASNKDHQLGKEEEKRRAKAEREKEKLAKQQAALERHKKKEKKAKNAQQPVEEDNAE